MINRLHRNGTTIFNPSAPVQAIARQYRKDSVLSALSGSRPAPISVVLYGDGNASHLRSGLLFHQTERGRPPPETGLKQGRKSRICGRWLAVSPQPAWHSRKAVTGSEWRNREQDAPLRSDRK